MQLLWLHRVKWDEVLTAELERKSGEFLSELNAISKIEVVRWLGSRVTTDSIELHGFGDASNQAYAAAVYMKVVQPNGAAKVSLLCAKTKVAPLKTQSIPKLELCASALLCKLLKFVVDSLAISNVAIFCWTDSQTVLHWLRLPPQTLKCFVANRVSLVQTSMPTVEWRYVPGKDNPADCASRGIPIDALRNHDLWWQGPSWLKEAPSCWPTVQSRTSADAEQELRPVPVHHVRVEEPEWDLVERCSDWQRLVRITGYILRFADHCLRRHDRAGSTVLSVAERDRATRCLIKREQREQYGREISCISKGQPLPSKSPLLSLAPYLDEDGALRVGGRLDASRLSEFGRHPYILPKGRVARLLIRWFHLRTKHGGVQVTLRALREQFWVVSSRSLTKMETHRCVICTRWRGRVGQQLMGRLPAIRVEPARPFEHVGLDYAGPLRVRLAAGRGRAAQKCYVAVFVCLCVRAIHLEVVSDYTTPAFLAAFSRFTARRGLPHKVYSDNGTNFQGADRELSRNFRALLADAQLHNAIANDGVSWEFIPPNAPHFGGIWEAGVKSMKHHLRRILGQYTPTMEELQTLLCGVEAILNSRPLTPLNDDVESCKAITPGHFLVGSLLTAPPAPSLLERDVRYLTRWQAMRAMYERFWHVWSSDFLNSLQLRTKWKAVRENLKEQDLVLLRDRNQPPTKWLLGRVLKVHRGRDGLVRVATVRTATSTLERPISQLCKLPIQQDVTTNPRQG